MEDKKQLKIIKLGIILIGIGFIGYIAIDHILHIPEHSEFELGTNDPLEIESGFGTIQLFDTSPNQFTDLGETSLIYSDPNLRFEISKPNLNWDFNSNLDIIVQENSKQLLSNGFRGGVYVEQNGDKTFFVAVFDISSKEQFLLDSYVNTQLDYLQNKFDTQHIVQEISPNNDWAIFGTIIKLANSTTYGEQLLQVHNSKLYMLQYTGTPPDKLNQNEKEERRLIVDSFRWV